MNRSQTAALVLMLVALAACSPDEESTGSAVSADQLRQLVTDAGASPTECPLDLDVAAALREAGIDDADVEPGEVDVEVSETTTPAPDSLQAQREEGMSALDAAAGVFVSCDYRVGDDSLEVDVTASPADAPAATYLLVPLLQEAGDLSPDQVEQFLGDVEEPGDLAVAPGDTAALAVVATDGGGSAGLLVTGGAVDGDALRTATEQLADDLTTS